jgi:SAM-dependent methyltransferase
MERANTSAPGVGMHPLPLTGERTLPGIPDERYWFERHVVAYRLAQALVRDHAPDVVLDAGCGEGYGLALLRDAGAPRVIGADLDAATVAHATATYATEPGVEVHRAELSSLPLADDEVALTVSFQVIEHLHDIPGFLASLGRVTRPNGIVAIATPNRLTFTPGSETPLNPFHTREFTAAELARELERAGYTAVTVHGVHHGRRLRAFEAARGTGLTELLTATVPEDWDPALRELVHGTTADDFEVRDDDLDASLDLVAVCRVPARRGDA